MSIAKIRKTAHAYGVLLAALCMQNGEEKQARHRHREGCGKYAFCGSLLRLGFIGAESKKQRMVLLKNLSSEFAFPTKAAADPPSQPHKRPRGLLQPRTPLSKEYKCHGYNRQQKME